MRSYWWSVVKEAFWLAGEAVGYPLQTAIYAILVLGLTALFIWRPNGWAAMKENLAKTIFEVICVGMAAWVPFFLFHILSVSYGRWKGADEAQTKITSEYHEYKKQIENRGFVGKIENIRVGVTDKKIPFALITLTVRNQGPPSSALGGGWIINIKTSDLNISEVPQAFSQPQKYFNEGKLVLSISTEDMIFEKMVPPLETGAYKTGMLVVYFHNLSPEQLEKKEVEWTVTFSDIYDREYIAKLTNIPFERGGQSKYYPGGPKPIN